MTHNYGSFSSLKNLLTLYAIGAISPNIGDIFVFGPDIYKGETKYIFTEDGFVEYKENASNNATKKQHRFKLRDRNVYPKLKEDEVDEALNNSDNMMLFADYIQTKQPAPTTEDLFWDEYYKKKNIQNHQKRTIYGYPGAVPRMHMSKAEKKEYEEFTKMIDEIFKDKDKIAALLNTLFDESKKKEKEKLPLMIINIEGIDAVGKESTSNALFDELTKLGLRVKRISFPRYSTIYGHAVKETLGGGCGDSSELDPELLGPLYSLDRIQYFRNYLDAIANTFDVLICDRSFYSNFIYQASKLSNDELPAWIKKNYKYEFINTGLEKYIPTMYTFVLTMDAESNKKQLETRDVLDGNEKNDKYLDKCRKFIKEMTNNAAYKARLKHCGLEWIPYSTAKCIPVQHVDPKDENALKSSIMNTVHEIIWKSYPLIEERIKNNK